jgi:hypothetical protein
MPCLTTLTCNAVVNQTYTTNQPICSCDNTTYLDTVVASATYGKCIPRITYGVTCKTNTDCKNWLGLACTSTTSSGLIQLLEKFSIESSILGLLCQCGSTSYWNGSICVQSKIDNQFFSFS